MTLPEEKELLLGVATKLAVGLIADEGGFVPFGAILGPGRKVKLLSPRAWKENATRDELESYWARELKKAVTDPDCRTVCSCAEVHIPRDDGSLAPCIFIHIEQALSFAEDIGYPYVKEGSQVKLGPPTTVETQARIFTAS